MVYGGGGGGEGGRECYVNRKRGDYDVKLHFVEKGTEFMQHVIKMQQLCFF
jgi:hypothetical protein